jgi:hypothetical protein
MTNGNPSETPPSPETPRLSADAILLIEQQCRRWIGRTVGVIAIVATAMGALIFWSIHSSGTIAADKSVKMFIEKEEKRIDDLRNKVIETSINSIASSERNLSLSEELGKRIASSSKKLSEQEALLGDKAEKIAVALVENSQLLNRVIQELQKNIFESLTIKGSNVGIGTTNPEHILHTRIENSNSDFIGLKVGRDVGAIPAALGTGEFVAFGYGDHSDGTRVRIGHYLQKDAGNNHRGFVIQQYRQGKGTGQDKNFVNDIFIDADTGRIGIGTTNPQASLHFVGEMILDREGGQCILQDQTGGCAQGWASAGDSNNGFSLCYQCKKSP